MINKENIIIRNLRRGIKVNHVDCNEKNHYDRAFGFFTDFIYVFGFLRVSAVG